MILFMCILVFLVFLFMLLLRLVFWGNIEVVLELLRFFVMLLVENVEILGNFYIGIYIYCGWNNMNVIDGFDNYFFLSLWILIM